MAHLNCFDYATVKISEDVAFTSFSGEEVLINNLALHLSNVICNSVVETTNSPEKGGRIARNE